VRNPERWRRVGAPGPHAESQRLERLEGGLILRRAGPGDVEALATFAGAVHADPPAFEYDPHVDLWTRELAGGSHPSMRVEDFLIVEDPARHRIASTLCLLSQRLRYGTVEIPAGHPELVGTHPDYRRRGLVARQFEVVHRWSEERGQRVQLIDGIPWYYRQFGYEMAMDNGALRFGPRSQLRGLRVDEALTVRDATPEDSALALRAWQSAGARSVLSAVRDEQFCRYELAGRGLSMRSRAFRVVEEEGRAIAFFGHWPVLLHGFLWVGIAEVEEGVPWTRVAATLFGDLRNTGRGYSARDESPFEGILLRLGQSHPLYEVYPERLPGSFDQHAWYVRVPDLPAFLMDVAAQLEENLADSVFAGHTGAIDVNTYREGYRLRLEQGRLVEVSSWQPSTEERGHVAFPDSSFLQLVFGYRELAELRASFADCVVQSDTEARVLQALFPRKATNLVPAD